MLMIFALSELYGVLKRCLFRYLRFIAEQNPEVGRFMRRGLEAYHAGDTCVSFLGRIYFK